MSGKAKACQTIEIPCRTELVIQKSRFLGILLPCQDAAEARERLRTLKSEYRDATHVVHAFICGSESSQTMGCSDDGEPSGTAGRPVLEVLKGEIVSNVFLAVIRWFGGVKLGTGGLSRAYAMTAKAVIAQALWVPLVQWKTVVVQVPFAEEGRVRRVLERFGVTRINQSYPDGPHLTFDVSEELYLDIEAAITAETQGQAQWKSSEP
ncbi:MAG: YigZ family protein [Spirochaetales bacterium]|nr:YigZ family protein [Spirochaetales bacterium]